MGESRQLQGLEGAQRVDTLHLVYVKAEQLNTMFSWKGSFEFCVRTTANAPAYRVAKGVEERPFTLGGWFSAVMGMD